MDLPLSEIFESSPTVAALAIQIDRAVANALPEPTAEEMAGRRGSLSGGISLPGTFEGPLEEYRLQRPGVLDGAEGVNSDAMVDNQLTYPLSHFQTSIWVTSLLSEELNRAYNIPIVMRFTTPCSTEALRSALQVRGTSMCLRDVARSTTPYAEAVPPLQGLLDRHSSLRTFYISTTDGPRQVVPGTPLRPASGSPAPLCPMTPIAHA